MSIETELQTVYDNLQTVLTDCNTALTGKGGAEAEALAGVAAAIMALPSGGGGGKPACEVFVEEGRKDPAYALVFNSSYNISYSSEFAPTPDAPRYSYGGTVLPKHPDEDYPYAVICRNSETGTYYAAFCDSPFKIHKVNYQYYLGGSSNTGAIYVHYEDTADWIQRNLSLNMIVQRDLCDMIWANADVMYDSSVFFAACSDPTPVN